MGREFEDVARDLGTEVEVGVRVGDDVTWSNEEAPRLNCCGSATWCVGKEDGNYNNNENIQDVK